LVAVPEPEGRFAAFDRLRGLIMAVMALDHASFFVARVHAVESWAIAPPYYAPHMGTPAAFSFFTRWITHPCAPGFFLLMGAGMMWFASARQKRGWSLARVRRFFVTRGLVLLAVQHLVENPAWLLGMVSADDALAPAVRAPGGGVDYVLHFGVISALAAAMIFWAFLIAAPGVAVALVSAAALAASVWMTPPASDAATLFPALTLIAFVPSHANLVNVLYPWVPWLAPAGAGILLARLVAARPGATAAVGGTVGSALLAGFVAMRAAALPLAEPHAALPGLAGFLTVTKYPPSPAFLAVTLGIVFLLLAALAATEKVHALSPLEVFGRAPLFFYLLHLWVFGLLSFAFPHGASFPVTYGVWAVALAAMYPACVRYARFKGGKPAGSVWRLF
jgi:uncharacterized membrane protein